MLVLWKGTGDIPEAMVLLFGTGLVGSAIALALERAMFFRRRFLPYDWSNHGLRREQTTEIVEQVHRAAPRRLAVVWAGGNGGFGSSALDMEGEHAQFREVLQITLSMCETMPESDCAFHMISSAGGLFEGQTQCLATTAPHPVRPYGEGKLAQEALLQASGLPDWAIYRPSSVYGYLPGGRPGLITTLIRNALFWRTTRIFGSPDTIRDYVLSTDIGRFIAERIEARDQHVGTINLLVSGRPMTMFETLRLVEEAMGMTLLVQYDPYPHNARSMSFLPTAMPKHWVSTPIRTGVYHTLMAMRSQLHGAGV